MLLANISFSYPKVLTKAIESLVYLIPNSCHPKNILKVTSVPFQHIWEVQTQRDVCRVSYYTHLSLSHLYELSFPTSSSTSPSSPEI